MRGRWRWTKAAGGFLILVARGLGRPLESLQRTHWVPLDLTDAEQTTDVATGAGGSMVYISGYSNAPPGEDGEKPVGALLMAFNSSGSQQWVVEYISAGKEYAYSVAADPTGAYLVGTTSGAQKTDSGHEDSDDTNAFAVKYNASGGLVWEQTWGTSESDIGNGVAVDVGEGLVYVVGTTRGSMEEGVSTSDSGGGSSGGSDDDAGAPASGVNAGGSDVFLTCLGATEGDIRWTKQFGSSSTDVGNSVAVGPRGGVFLVGQLGDDEGPVAGPRAFLAKYDYLGNLQFKARLNSSSTHYAVDLAPSVGSGGEGVVYMSGYTLGDVNTMFLARFEGSAGTQTWLSHLGSEDGGSHYAKSVTVVEGSTDATGAGSTGMASPPGSTSDSGAGPRSPTVDDEIVEPGSDARVLVVGYNISAASARSHTSTGFTVAADTEGAWTWHEVCHRADSEIAIAMGSTGPSDADVVSAFVVGAVDADSASPGNNFFLDIREVLRVPSPTPSPLWGSNSTLEPTTALPSTTSGEKSATTGLSQGASLWLLIIAPTFVVISCILMVGYVSKQCAILLGADPRKDPGGASLGQATYEDPDTGRRLAAQDILALRRGDSSGSSSVWNEGAPSSAALGRLPRPRSEGGAGKVSGWPRAVAASFLDSGSKPSYRKLDSPGSAPRSDGRDRRGDGSSLVGAEGGEVEMGPRGSTHRASGDLSPGACRPLGNGFAAHGATSSDEDGPSNGERSLYGPRRSAAWDASRDKEDGGGDEEEASSLSGSDSAVRDADMSFSTSEAPRFV